MRIKVSKLIELLLDCDKDGEVEVFMPNENFSKEIEEIIATEQVSSILIHKELNELGEEVDYLVNNAIIVHEDFKEEKKLLLF